MLTHMPRVALLLLLGLSSACSSYSSPAMGAAGTGGDAQTSAAGNHAGGMDGKALYGSVVVALQQPADGDGYTTAIGRFFDGAQPQILALESRRKQGDCTLFVPKAPFCNTPCAPAVCTANDVCTPYPAVRAVGTLTLKGLGAPVPLEPSTSMMVYQSPSLPFPPCEAGDPVSASANGVSLSTQCIAPLALKGPDPIPVNENEPLRLSWEPAKNGATSRVHVKLDVSHHGGSKGEIDCDTADTGELQIAASLVTDLLSLGLAGFPTININRTASGADASNPNATLVLSSDLTRAVDTGVVSCLDDDACAKGQTCLPSGICG